MSNHRSEVEVKEKLIAEYLNDSESPIRRSSRMSGTIADKISDEYDGTIEDASHIGNSYDSIGDMKLTVDGIPNYIELKILDDKPSNFGTLANISPKIPIKSEMFSGDPMEWKAFLQNQGHTENVLSILDRFPNYPDCVTDKCSTDLNTKEHKGRYIRDLVKDRTTKDFDSEVAEDINPSHSLSELEEIASQIKSDIEEFDRKIKIRYIEYLSDFDVNSDRVKAYSIILIAGYHKKSQVLNYLDVVDKVVEEYGFSDVGDVFQNYEVFYAYKQEDGIKLNRDERSNVIDELSDIPTEDYEVRFGGSGDDVSNTGFSIGVNKDDKFEPLIRLALHWGNVFQGIATRRFNCFKEKKLNKLASN